MVKPYRVYIAAFGFKGECRLRVADGKLNHRSMLSAEQFERFKCSPQNWVMGRLRETVCKAQAGKTQRGGSALVLDTISECYWDQTRESRPISRWDEAKLFAFLAALRKQYPGARVLLLDGGKDRRVSGLSEAEFSAIAAGTIPADCRWLA